ncbi:pyridoxamine 5'-phosphate oxidase family protein [Iamia sp. SCSIO 61187]|uniref:pyridoxamine 5'-phosphate oxidase family protein n=1 Tax=Iamia sp. SCSIO 61187 TaxID=2722752 RepID=UPI001C631A93|nr:pyridoxamine 5'-phosphate oxidase family protein [Iamia sp. SCSIO 61187]QYG91937.1 pyridoxamine 5'-phosphate oxidase family protein [Iamia sp. SCSIO 61187]
MHETTEDLARLQAVLDASHAAAGAHLREIITPERRLTAAQLSEQLTGMTLLVLATSTADGRPIAGPVDGIFYRGRFHFGSSPDSVRFRHIRRRPAVSATHLPGEHLNVTVHGRAEAVDASPSGDAGFRRALLDVYTPTYGDDWEQFLDSGPVYARIEPDKMFTFSMPEAGAGG